MSRRRVDLREAAESLGTSVDAIRKRVQRGSLDSEKGEDGKVYVWLDDRLEGESNALISELRDRVAFLERELEVRSDEMRRRDTIIMNMTEAMKAIPPPAQEGPPSDTRESPVTATDEAGSAVTPLPWWRRIFR